MSLAKHWGKAWTRHANNAANAVRIDKTRRRARAGDNLAPRDPRSGGFLDVRGLTAASRGPLAGEGFPHRPQGSKQLYDTRAVRGVIGASSRVAR